MEFYSNLIYKLDHTRLDYFGVYYNNNRLYSNIRNRLRLRFFIVFIVMLFVSISFFIGFYFYETERYYEYPYRFSIKYFKYPSNRMIHDVSHKMDSSKLPYDDYDKKEWGDLDDMLYPKQTIIKYFIKMGNFNYRIYNLLKRSDKLDFVNDFNYKTIKKHALVIRNLNYFSLFYYFIICLFISLILALLFVNVFRKKYVPCPNHNCNNSAEILVKWICPLCKKKQYWPHYTSDRCHCCRRYIDYVWCEHCEEKFYL